MKTLGRLVFRERSALTVWQVIQWWELRRVAFNILVGTAGLISAVIMVATGAMMEAHGYEAVGIPNPPIAAILAALLYGLMANICYTGGWLSELIARRIWPAESSSYAKIVFAIGLLGSVLLTLLPALLTVVVSLGEVIVGASKTH